MNLSLILPFQFLYFFCFSHFHKNHIFIQNFNGCRFSWNNICTHVYIGKAISRNMVFLFFFFCWFIRIIAWLILCTTIRILKWLPLCIQATIYIWNIPYLKSTNFLFHLISYILFLFFKIVVFVLFVCWLCFTGRFAMGHGLHMVCFSQLSNILTWVPSWKILKMVKKCFHSFFF